MMRRTTLMMGRIISLCLAFVLGFFSAFGAIAGGIYYAYSSVSLEKLNEWGSLFGFSVPFDDFVDPEAETPATSLTLQDLFAEIQQIQDDELTLAEMIEKYGLIIPEDIIESMPDPVMKEIPFALLMSEEGIQLMMQKVTVVDIINMIPDEIAATIVSDPARDAFSDNTLAEIVAMDMGHIFEGVQLGYITGVTYVLDENGVYQAVWADPLDPTLFELIAPLDLGGILKAVSNGEGDVLEVIENSIGDVSINSIFTTFMDDIAILSNLLGEATLGDLIIFDAATGEYTIDIMKVMEGRKVGMFLGYTEVVNTDPETLEVTYGWKDANGNAVKGLSAKFADICLVDFMTGEVSVDTLMNDLIIADVLGYEKGKKLPVFMHDNLANQLILEEDIVVWYSNGAPADKMMNAFAGKSLTWIGSSLSTLKLADILGYHMYDGAWYIWNVQSVNDGSDAIVLSPATGMMAQIADTTIGGIGDIESTLKDIQIGILLGYNSIEDENGDHAYWSTGTDENGQPIAATGITASMADLTVNELADGSSIQSTINDITLADVMGYTRGEDGKWYKGGEVVSGPMAALADSKVGTLATDINHIHIGELLGHTPVYTTDSEGNEIIDYWVDGNGDKVEGLMAAFVGLSVDDMKNNGKVMDAIQHIRVADVMGLEFRDGTWYNSDGTKATGIMAAIADVNIGELSTEMQNITIGEMLGLYEENGVWYNSDGTKSSGVVASLADTSVGNLNSELNNIKVGEILGFTYNESEGCWYDGNVKASGVTGALADSKLITLNEDLSHLLVGEIAGYTRLSANDPHASEGEGWYTFDGSTYTKATGILAELSDLTVNQLTDSNGSALTDKIGNVKLAEALGYTNVDGVWYDKSGAPLTGIMSALADKPINDMSSAVDELTLNDIFPGERTGILSVIDGDTKIDKIDEAVNDSMMKTPLQFFIDEGIISFDAETMRSLDLISNATGEVMTLTDEMINTGYYDKWIAANSTEIPVWRTQELTASFNYIVGLLTRGAN